MLGLFIQCGMAILLLLAAVQLRASINRQRSKDWEGILARIVRYEGRLSQLSYGSIFSSGLACPTDEVWDRIDGRQGIWAIFINAGVLLEAMSYLERFGNRTPQFQQTMEELREQGRRVRVSAMIVLLRSLMPLRQGPAAISDIALIYTCLVAGLSLAISDHCPELLIKYRFFIKQS